jgi:hypothetical protein
MNDIIFIVVSILNVVLVFSAEAIGELAGRLG